MAIIPLARDPLHSVSSSFDRELYQDEGDKKKAKVDLNRQEPYTSISIEDLIKFMIEADYEVLKKPKVG
jgi:hypothetical protein